MEALADAGAETTAMAWVEAKAVDQPGSAQHVVGTLDGPPPAEVLQAHDTVILLSPVLEGQVELELIFIDAVLAAGHRPHAVRIAADGFEDPGCEVRFMRSHRLIAVHLESTGLPITYLAPTINMENLLEAALTIREQGSTFAPAGQARIGFIAVSDVAKAAARVLTSDGPEDATSQLTGPESARLCGRRDASLGRLRPPGWTTRTCPSTSPEQMLTSGLTPRQTEGTTHPRAPEAGCRDEAWILLTTSGVLGGPHSEGMVAEAGDQVEPSAKRFHVAGDGVDGGQFAPLDLGDPARGDAHGRG